MQVTFIGYHPSNLEHCLALASSLLSRDCGPGPKTQATVSWVFLPPYRFPWCWPTASLPETLAFVPGFLSLWSTHLSRHLYYFALKPLAQMTCQGYHLPSPVLLCSACWITITSIIFLVCSSGFLPALGERRGRNRSCRTSKDPGDQLSLALLVYHSPGSKEFEHMPLTYIYMDWFIHYIVSPVYIIDITEYTNIKN